MKKASYIPVIALMAVSCQNINEYDATGIFEATTVTVAARF